MSGSTANRLQGKNDSSPEKEFEKHEVLITESSYLIISCSGIGITFLPIVEFLKNKLNVGRKKKKHPAAHSDEEAHMIIQR